MGSWLEQPVTRAEAMGWALAVPAVLGIAFLGSSIVPTLGAFEHLSAREPGLTPTFLAVCLALGPGGMTTVFAFCGLLALGAQLTRQRPLLRVAAPLVGVLLAGAVSARYLSTAAELTTNLVAVRGESSGVAPASAEAPR